MINLVEMITDEQSPAPCAHGNYVDGHAVYCHHPDADMPRKCPIYKWHGLDSIKWHAKNSFNDDAFEEVGGCSCFAATA